MKVLMIGGTGLISSAVTELALEKGIDLYLLNRGTTPLPEHERLTVFQADINDREAVRRVLDGHRFDSVVNFIAFTVDHVERDYALFKDITRQYVFISSASAYQKPLSNPVITESTPLHNPYWPYSQNKIACEDYLMARYRQDHFPITIVRPSHTYAPSAVPLGLFGEKGAYSVIQRMRRGKKVLVHGDGTTFWTVTHHRDFAKGFVGLLGNPHAIGESFHITNDEWVTWNQIYESLAAALNVEAHIVHIPSDALSTLSGRFYGGFLGEKTYNVIFDNSKIKQLVPEFNATIRIDEGLREAVAYIDAHEECRIEDPDFDAWCDAVIEKYEALVAALPKYTK